MQFLPLFFRTNNQQWLIVGGGSIAQRRSKVIIKSGAKVNVIAPDIKDDLSQSVLSSGGEIILRPIEQADIDNCYNFIVAATNDTALNAEIANWAKALNIPINVVSDKNLCDFIFPSVIDRDPMTIAVSNSGQSPVMTRILKEQIAHFLPDAYGELAALIGLYRQRVNERFSDNKKRSEFWQAIINGTVGEAFISGRHEEAKWLLEKAIEDSEHYLRQGEVYLIGAGPGDASLLTLRAFRLIQQADVVIFDRLVSQSILALIKHDAKKLFVGKQRSHHSVPQPQINQLLIDYAKKGKRVARLKGGDPFIFGRGGEEIEALAEAGIFFQVVPGITAANACASYAGIPLTHRDYAQSVQFITGQLKNGSVDLNWDELIQDGKTLVFYMALKTIPIIAKNLQKHGMASDMEVAIIEKGGNKEQRVFTTTLTQVESLLNKQNIVSPALCIVGRVVTLADKLAWYKNQPTSPEHLD